MYTQYVNGYDKSMAVLQETMSQNLPFSQLVKQFQVLQYFFFPLFGWLLSRSDQD